MSNGELPEGFFGWVLGGVAAVIATLAAAVANLFRISENKNADAIKEQEKEIAVLRTQVKTATDSAKETEKARVECEKDRASLAMECKYIKE